MTRSEHINGYCPACGNRTLSRDPDGSLECVHPVCPDPDAARQVLADSETQHIVQFGTVGFTIRHPLIERIGDRLMLCPLHRHIESLHGPPMSPGTYRATESLASDWAYEEIR